MSCPWVIFLGPGAAQASLLVSIMACHEPLKPFVFSWWFQALTSGAESEQLALGGLRVETSAAFEHLNFSSKHLLVKAEPV